MKNLIEKYNVSRETLDQLKSYLSLLNEWQQKFNLVSNSSLEDAWTRHFLDSLQLYPFIPQNAETLVDFGSGAGFPGMVLAIVAKEKTPYLKVTLVESIKKKTVYLNEVAQQTNTNVNIINDRIENLARQKFDVITSRAMTALTDLLNYAFPFCHAQTVCIFPKGKNYAAELAEAHKKWRFKCQLQPSEVSEESKILIITNITKKKEKTHAKNFSHSKS
jgi:16S rRNA (guanine527-N7)-methyltransferase